ncbi:hypothetical protein LTR95_000943 [Oleoguttula sp. CCFEE 5521]
MARKPRLSQFQRQRYEATMDVKSKAAAIAGKKVLQIPELLEMVLAHLDIRTLLLLQRVNTTWKATIDNSAELQEKLFYRLTPGTHDNAINTLILPINIITREDFNYSPSFGSKTTWLYTLDMSTLPQHASARKMFLSRHRKPRKCPVPRESMCFVEGNYGHVNGPKVSGWVFATSVFELRFGFA